MNTDEERAKAAKAAIDAMAAMYRTCLTCKHFNEGLEVCELYKAQPPARVIAYACPSYTGIDPFT